MAQQKNHVAEVPFFALCNNDEDVSGTATREQGLGERCDEGTDGVYRIFDVHTASIAVFECGAVQC